MTEFKLDRWLEVYASRIGTMKSSEIRELLAVTARPDIISFAGGLPDTSCFPMEHIVEAVSRVMRQDGAAALQYGPSEGHLGLKEHLVDIMADEGVEVETDDFIITDGAQQALDLVAKVFIGEGDTIITEGPSYVGALQAFAAYEPNIVTVPLDEHGMKTDILAARIAQTKASGNPPKFIYCVPNFHNPVGVTLSARRREELVRLVEQHDLVLIEDNPYGKLRFDGEPCKSLKQLHDSTIYMGTMSKIFSPGIRLGWVAAPRPILEKIICAKQAANLCSSSLSQRIAEEYFSSYPWREHVERLVDLYRARRDVMLEALEEFFPEGSVWTRPEGGLFIWASLPEGLDTAEMLAEAIQEAKVAYVPGGAFYPAEGGKNSMRLNFSFCEADVIYPGIKRLGKVAKGQLELYRSLVRDYEPERQKE